MAVRVMVAPAIANGALEKSAAARQREKVVPAKPKRRRSSVYDAEGNEVFITLMCLKCHKMRPLSQFGLRKMADGAIRNQPWCKGCRAESAARSPRRVAEEEAAGTGDSSPAGDSPEPRAAEPAPSNLAAQIAAALHAGRR